MAPAEDTARAHLGFLDAYDLDWLKLMNDYPYPMPEGVETIDDPRQLAAMSPLDPARTPLGEQLRVVEILARALSGRAVFVDTVFDAWNTLRRSVLKDAIGPFMRDAPAEVEHALRAINESCTRTARAPTSIAASTTPCRRSRGPIAAPARRCARRVP